MFKRIKTIKGHQYFYLEHSFRAGSEVKKVSFYIPKGKPLDLNNLANQSSIKKIIQLRLNHIKKNQRFAKFFSYGKQTQIIEEKKLIFQILSKVLSKQDRKSILNEFLRTFLVNSMAMEGGTISYDIAKAIEEKKKIRVKGINELDIPLYLQLKQAWQKLQKMQLRYPKQIRELHEIIFKGIYPFAGKFREKKVTFGDIRGLAVTSDPAEIQQGYRKALQKFYNAKGKVYDFQRVIEFHKDFQRIHGFKDGNSRLGRLIMINQLIKLGYPPFLIKGNQSRTYRICLIRAINEDNNTALLKFFYNSYKRTYNKFWTPVLEEKIK